MQTKHSSFRAALQSARFTQLKHLPKLSVVFEEALPWLEGAYLFGQDKTERSFKLPVIDINTVTPVSISWFWNPYIALGKVSLIEGNPGVGKSWLCASLCAAVSRGEGLPGMEPTTPGTAVWFTQEDDAADTLQPRLVSMGADLSKVKACAAPITFNDEGFLQIEEMVAVLEPRLLIFDTLITYMAGTDIHRANQVREVMSRLSLIAAKFQLAIIGIRHLSKGNGGNVITRGLGSIDFAGSVRSILLAGCDPDDESVKGLVHTKSNLAMKGENIGYAITNDGLKWTGKSDLTAERILCGTSDVEGFEAKKDAEEFLRDLLKEGPVSAKQITDEAQQAGISLPTLKRAKKSAGVESYRTGGVGKEGVWFWCIPAKSIS